MAKKIKVSKNEYKFPNDTTGKYIWGIIYPSLIYIGVSVIGGVIAGIIIGILAIFIKGMDAVAFANEKAMLLNLIVQIIATAIILPIYLHHKKHYYPEIKNKKIDIKEIIFIVLAFMGLSAISATAFDFLERILNPADGGIETINSIIASGSLIEIILSTVIMAPIIEELIFRGLTLNRALSKGSVLRAMTISAFLFGFIHFNLIQGLNAFVLGLILAYVYIKTKSLWPCMLCHLVNNSFAVIGLYISTRTNNIITYIMIALSIYPIIYLIKNHKNN